jgi:hypothetical protein
VDGLALLETGVLLSGEDLESVSAKVVSLGLEQVGGDGLRSVAVEEGEGGGVGGDGDTGDGGLGNDSPPSRLGLGNGVLEARWHGEARLGTQSASRVDGGRERGSSALQVVEEQVLEVLVLLESLGDVTKEDGLDDASSTPHGSDTGVLRKRKRGTDQQRIKRGEEGRLRRLTLRSHLYSLAASLISM